MNTAQKIKLGQTSIGIEFGSTRIKAVMVDENSQPIASGSHTWENKFENGFWTYSTDDITDGLHSCYNSLSDDVMSKYGVKIETVGSIGISGMMHGYMAFDENDNLLVPFRTWRNTTTADAAKELTELFGFNIPQRWSVAHFYQAIINGEEHIKSVCRLSTLAVYIHYMLTGEFVAGAGEASGMFPIDSHTGTYDKKMIENFDEAVKRKGFTKKISDILPVVLTAGENAGYLTESGARFLDESGTLKPGIPLCPPEGDAGTGMVATNSVRERTGNVSAGTSIFAMVVLEKPLKEMYPQIDMVTTPSGSPVAMVHCNNCTGDIDAWVNVFSQFIRAAGFEMKKSELYDLLYLKATEGEKNCGGVISYNYISGEPVSDLSDGRPMLIRMSECDFTLANFMRSELYSAFAALKNGMDILLKKENVLLDNISAHGGLYKTPGVGQSITAAALNTKVTVSETAGEGGPWGMAILARYMLAKNGGGKLEDFIDGIFKNSHSVTVEPDKDDVAGFEEFMVRYNSGLAVEKAAVEKL